MVEAVVTAPQDIHIRAAISYKGKLLAEGDGVGKVYVKTG